jgi:hypothetical protein
VLATFAADRTGSTLADLGTRPSPADQAAALVDGWQLAFVIAAVLVLIGAVLMLALVRPRDVANVNPEQAVLPA